MDTIRYGLKSLNRQFQLANNLTSLLDTSFFNARSFFTGPTRKDESQKWLDFVMTF